ncbi:signal recognition particle-docking protein FtsY [Candidatus Bipolaricaulota bacterium]
MAWIDRLKAGLSKTRTGLTSTISQVLGGRKKLSADDVELLEEALIAGDVGAQTAMVLVEELQAAMSRNDSDPILALQTLILERLAGIERSLSLRSDQQPTVFMVAGVNGAGKTTTIAKLASQLRTDHPKLPITFAAADTFRAAAIEQLGIWAERIGVDFIRHQPGADPSAVVFDALDHAIRTGGALFVDTAGRLQTKHNLMEELKKIERTVAKKLGRGSDERLLVLDASTGQNGISQAQHFHEAIDLSGIVLTKVDGTAKGGVVLAIWDALRIPLTHIGVGETADDLHAFSAAEFVEALFDS